MTSPARPAPPRQNDPAWKIKLFEGSVWQRARIYYSRIWTNRAKFATSIHCCRQLRQAEQPTNWRQTFNFADIALNLVLFDLPSQNTPGKSVFTRSWTNRAKCATSIHFLRQLRQAEQPTNWRQTFNFADIALNLVPFDLPSQNTPGKSVFTMALSSKRNLQNWMSDASLKDFPLAATVDDSVFKLRLFPCWFNSCENQLSRCILIRQIEWH